MKKSILLSVVGLFFVFISNAQAPITLFVGVGGGPANVRYHDINGYHVNGFLRIAPEGKWYSYTFHTGFMKFKREIKDGLYYSFYEEKVPTSAAEMNFHYQIGKLNLYASCGLVIDYTTYESGENEVYEDMDGNIYQGAVGYSSGTPNDYGGLGYLLALNAEYEIANGWMVNARVHTEYFKLKAQEDYSVFRFSVSKRLATITL